MRLEEGAGASGLHLQLDQSFFVYYFTVVGEVGGVIYVDDAGVTSNDEGDGGDELLERGFGSDVHRVEFAHQVN